MGNATARYQLEELARASKFPVVIAGLEGSVADWNAETKYQVGIRLADALLREAQT